MADNKPATAKRAQLDTNKTVIFATIAVASIVVVASLVIGKGVWSRANYLGKVAGEKEEALKQLESNKEALTELKASYEEFNEQNPNLIGGSPDATGGNNGTNSALVLDALPSKYDFPALTASVEKLLTGYTLNSITGTDDALAQSSNTASGVVEIPISINIAADYTGFKNLIDVLNRSIRPFHITKLNLSGNNTNLQVDMDIMTYYQPEQALMITKVPDQ